MTKLSCLFVAIFLFTSLPARAHIEKGPPSCDVVKVEGKGKAQVRRKSGVLQMATEAMQIYAGDRVITDSDSVVSLFFADGSLMKVGINSEYLLKETEEKNRVIQYVFDLFKGSVKAMVENFSAKQPARYRLSTPEGTIGIRGTAFTLEHDPATNVTRLDLTEGSVMAGPVGCHSNNSCTKLQAPARSEFSGKKMIPIKISQATANTDDSANKNGESQTVQGTKAMLESKGSTEDELAAQNKKLEELQAELLGISLDSLKKLKAANAESLSQFRQGASRYRDAMGVVSPDGSEYEGRTLALGEALSRQEGFNKGNLSKKLLKKAPADRTVQEYTSYGTKEQIEGGSRTNWRDAFKSGDNHAPSAAIQAQQRSAAEKKLDVKSTAVRMTNRGGILLNESTAVTEEKSVQAPVASPQVQQQPTAPTNATLSKPRPAPKPMSNTNPTPGELVTQSLSNPTGPTPAPPQTQQQSPEGHAHCHFHAGSGKPTCEWHVIGSGHHN